MEKGEEEEIKIRKSEDKETNLESLSFKKYSSILIKINMIKEVFQSPNSF